mmetsp:Transcript_10124/g.23657  ORF Transcript_10124/g.23657 Transcript_10124/m.23657 type:complete len:240 (+) Transcript_10124:276-995(+)
MEVLGALAADLQVQRRPDVQVHVLRVGAVHRADHRRPEVRDRKHKRRRVHVRREGLESREHKVQLLDQVPRVALRHRQHSVGPGRGRRVLDVVLFAHDNDWPRGVAQRLDEAEGCVVVEVPKLPAVQEPVGFDRPEPELLCELWPPVLAQILQPPAAADAVVVGLERLRAEGNRHREHHARAWPQCVAERLRQEIPEPVRVHTLRVPTPRACRVRFSRQHAALCGPVPRDGERDPLPGE